jgi:hypothetical protein
VVKPHPMTWREKLEITRRSLPDHPTLEIVFELAAAGAPEAFISALRSQYPFITNDYLEFLRFSDGAQLWMFVLFGSKPSTFPSIPEARSRWASNLGDRLPIGEDPSGMCLVMERAGNIVTIDYTTDAGDHVESLASTLGEFLDEVLLGPRFPELFKDSREGPPENEWTAHLRHQGWLR